MTVFQEWLAIKCRIAIFDARGLKRAIFPLTRDEYTRFNSACSTAFQQVADYAISGGCVWKLK